MSGVEEKIKSDFRGKNGQFKRGYIPWNRGLTIKNSKKMRIIAKKTSLTQRGKHHSPKTEFKKGVRNNPDGEFRKGVRSNPKGEFKKGQVPWNASLTKKTSDKVKEMAERTAQTRMELFKKGNLQSRYAKYWLELKGKHHSPKTEFKKGEHPSPKTEF